MSTRERRHGAFAAAALAVGGLVVASAVPVSAADAATPRILVSTDGVNFSVATGVDVFDDLGLLVPGNSLSTSVWVKNNTSDPGVFRLAVTRVVTPSPQFANGVSIVSTDGSTSRSSAFADLKACTPLVSSTAIAAGGVVRVDISAAMDEAVSGLDAQNESADLDLGVIMRDAALGAFPDTDACYDFTGEPEAGGEDSMASTGVDILPTLSLAAASLLGGFIALILARRRRRDDDEEAA